ncbi:MAG TPA: hypothetical protein VFG66_03020 [Gemmatimonadales bacterium]|nr:hypothetical protein [Gemmatimonadales bacterium]
MTSGRWPLPVRLAVLLMLVLMTTPVRHVLEASMTAQMLVQLPLLVVAGWLISLGVTARALTRVERWNHSGITGLIVATVAAAFWMLPRSLDASTSHPLMAAAKYLSVPLLIGLPFALSWRRMGFVLRGLILAEIVASCFRLGWLYRISPIRLCTNYGLDDQRRLGGILLALGGGLLVWLAWKLLWGRFETVSRIRPGEGRVYRRTVQTRYCRTPPHVASIRRESDRHSNRGDDAVMAQHIELEHGAAAGV